MTTRYVYARLLISGGAAEVRINDIPVIREVEPARRVTSVPIHEFLVPGRNVMTLHAQPLGPEPAPVEAHASVAVFERGEMMAPGAGQGLAETVWRWPEPTPPQAFDIPSMPRWAWPEAPVLKLDAALRARLDQFVGKVHEAFAARDGAKLVTALGVPLQDVRTAYGPEIMELHRAAVVDGLAEAGEDWAAAPFEPGDPEAYRLVAGGRMVDCVDGAGRPLVRNDVDPSESPDADAAFFPFSMMVGMLNGRLAVLR